VCRAKLPPGTPLFDQDQLTDRSVRFSLPSWSGEAIRLLAREIPYGLAVTIERWTESEGRALIEATVWVERESHRAS